MLTASAFSVSVTLNYPYSHMNKILSLILSFLALPLSVASGNDSFDSLPKCSVKRLSGSLTLGYDTLANDRGVVLSHSVLGGDGSPIGLLKYNYDFGKKNAWSWDGMVYFRDVTSGHRLYGCPNYGYDAVYSMAYGQAIAAGLSASTASAVASSTAAVKSQERVKQANAESEWVLQNGLKYTRDKWNVAMGHSFIRGGVLGVFAKHFRHQGASCLNEVYLRPEWTPAPWVTVGVDLRYSFSGIHGWWFLPDITFKAPLWSEGDTVKLAAVAKFAMAATADYFDETDSACNNGSQAYYCKLSMPWFVNDNWVLTPGMGLHWLGKGAIYVNKRSKFAIATGNSTYVPFRNFAVVGSFAATYRF